MTIEIQTIEGGQKDVTSKVGTTLNKKHILSFFKDNGWCILYSDCPKIHDSLCPSCITSKRNCGKRVISSADLNNNNNNKKAISNHDDSSTVINTGYENHNNIIYTRALNYESNNSNNFESNDTSATSKIYNSGNSEEPFSIGQNLNGDISSPTATQSK